MSTEGRTYYNYTLLNLEKRQYLPHLLQPEFSICEFL